MGQTKPASVKGKRITATTDEIRIEIRKARIDQGLSVGYVRGDKKGALLFQRISSGCMVESARIGRGFA
jgi:hypothetical protein